MPNLSSPFSLAHLPKTGLNGKKADRTSNVSACSAGGLFYVGVSSSSVSVYDVRPTPRLRWTHSIPPGTMVSHVASVPGTSKSVVFAGKERNKPFIRMIHNSQEPESKSEVHNMSVSDSVNFILCSQNYTTAVFDNGVVETFDSALERSVHTCTDLQEGGSVVAVFETDKKMLVVVQKNAVSIVASEDLDGSVQVVSTRHLTYDAGSPVLFNAGYLYTVVPSESESTVLRQTAVLATSQQDKFIQTSAGPQSTITSMLALDAQTILVASNELLLMIDTKFESCLASRSLSGECVTLLCYSTAHRVALGHTSNEIVGFSVDPSKGSLLESVGRGMKSTQATTSKSTNPSYQQYINEHGPLLTRQKGNSRMMQSGVFAEQQQRKQDLENQDPQDILPFLRKYQGNVDRRLILHLCVRVFGLVPTKSGLFKVQPGFKIQKSSLDLAEYLLQHPLFPAVQIKGQGLLSLLLEQDQPELFRIAVSSTPGLDCSSVVTALRHPSAAVFISACNRLVNEFSMPLITQTVRDSWSVERMRQCIERLIQNEQFGLVTCFLDAGSLVRWTPDDVKTFRSHVDQQVAKVDEMATLSSLLMEVLRRASKENKRRAQIVSDDQQPADQPYIEEGASAGHRLVLGLNKDESMLRSDRYNASSTSELVQETLMMGQRVPVYSIERLVL